MSSTTHQRIEGLDVARFLAVAGMATIHFVAVLSPNAEPSFFSWFVDRLAGRPATVFLLLAGIGVSLQVRPESQDLKKRFLKRGIFFLVFGFANLAIWPGDILRVYGIAYLVAALLLAWKGRQLLTAAASIVSVFVIAIFTIDFETNWDFKKLEYENLWTFQGAILNLFYNGFRAVFPWLAIFIVGIVMGRSDLTDRSNQRRLFVTGISLWVCTELISRFLVLWTTNHGVFDEETSKALLGTDSLPPMPLFLLSSLGLGMCVIMLSIWAQELPSLKRFLTPFAQTGRLAFTWYLLHIIVVLTAGYATSFEGTVPIAQSLLASLLFAISMVAVSNIYLARFRLGPLEALMRLLTK